MYVYIYVCVYTYTQTGRHACLLTYSLTDSPTDSLTFLLYIFIRTTCTHTSAHTYMHSHTLAYLEQKSRRCLAGALEDVGHLIFPSCETSHSCRQELLVL